MTVFSARPRQHRLPYVFAAVTILALAFAIIMALTIYDFVHQYGVPGGADVGQRVRVYMSRGQEDRAVNLLEESLNGKGADSPAKEQMAWRLMLDQALYSSGKKLAAAGKFRDAVTAFARISSNYAGHEEVEKLISEYTDKGLPAVFGKAEEVDPSFEKEKRPQSKLEKAVMTAVPGGAAHIDLAPLSSQTREASQTRARPPLSPPEQAAKQ
jgi:hypothetical protein